MIDRSLFDDARSTEITTRHLQKGYLTWADLQQQRTDAFGRRSEGEDETAAQRGGWKGMGIGRRTEGEQQQRSKSEGKQPKGLRQRRRISLSVLSAVIGEETVMADGGPERVMSK